MGSSSGQERSVRELRPVVSEGARGPSARSGAVITEVNPIAPGHRVGRYVIRERLGAGGMGVVYAADDPELDRVVALKLLLSERGDKAAARRTRMQREAQAMARLKHANVVGVLDVGVYDDRVFIAMEYLEGARTLDDWIEQDDPSWEEILAAFMQAGEGLAAAHEAGLVHRDFKPENVLVSRDGHVRVTDFGLARPVDANRWDVSLSSVVVAGEPVMADGLTKTGAALGTPAYMAPEQHRREHVDERSDQFSFCVALFECLYGLPPFEGGDQKELADSVTRGRVRQPPWDTKVKPYVWRVMRRGLIADPRERFKSLPELLVALRRDPGHTVRRVVLWGTFGSLALGATIVAAVQLMPTDATCGDGQEQLAGVWDDQRRNELQAVFARIETGYAPEAWARVERGLSAYAQSWVEAHHRACLTSQEGASNPAGVQRRMACLTQRKQALAAVIDVVATADAPSLTHAIGALQRLPSLLPCDEVGERDAPARPGQAESDQLSAAGARLQRARALSGMARYPEAEREVEVALTAAEALDDPDLLSVAAYERGLLAIAQDDDEAARVFLERAFFAAQRAGNPGLAVDAAADLGKTVGVRMADPEGGLEWIRHARAAMERLGTDADREAKILHALAEIDYGRGDYDGARGHAGQGVALLEEAPRRDAALLAATLNTLGNALRAAALYEEALAQFERVRRIRERLWGENHPKVGQALNNLGTTERQLGRLDAALLHLHRAALVLERSMGADHPSVATPSIHLAEVYGDRGEVDVALRYADRAVALTEAAHGRDHLETVLHRVDRARLVLRLDGEAARVADELAACARVLESDFAEHPRLGAVLALWARAALAAGDTESASTAADRALRALPVTGGRDKADPKRAALESVLARAEWVEWADGGDQTAAVRRMQGALRVLDGAGEAWQDEADVARRWLDARPPDPVEP
ncbi:MAG: serine/threonine-protein kinase [Myxococcota bacterium]